MTARGVTSVAILGSFVALGVLSFLGQPLAGGGLRRCRRRRSRSARGVALPSLLQPCVWVQPASPTGWGQPVRGIGIVRRQRVF